MPAFKDLTDMIFGNVRVDSRAPSKRINSRTQLTMWNCTCLLCNRQFVVRGSNLTSGNTTTDGCTNKEGVSKAQLHDLTGQRFGKLVVMERAPDKIRNNGYGRTQWVCVCDCGEIVTVLAERLISGMTKSCGCLRKELAAKYLVEDLTGQRFNHLLVVERAENLDNGTHTAWLCLCDCGEYTIVRAACLKNGTTQSCGCLKFSINAEKIENKLKEANVYFTTEYKFEDLYRVKGHFLRFDFALYDNKNNLACLIEYQGQQHFEERINESFGKIQREVTDPMKKEYCKNHNIPLFEIRYDDDISEKINTIVNSMNLKYVNPVPSEQETV